MGNSKLTTPFDNLIGNGSMLLIDLFAQLINLIVALQKESDSIKSSPDESSDENKTDKLSGSPISVRALKTSIILLQFSALETIANFLSGLAIRINSGIPGAPDVNTPLTQVEIDFLKEERTYLDTGTGALKLSGSVFVSTLDKLAMAPLLLGRLHDQNYRLDKGGNGWRSIQRLKEIRDQLTHFKLDGTLMEGDESISLDLDNVKPAVTIKNRDIFNGGEAMKWYIQQVIDLLSSMYTERHWQLVTRFQILQFMNWMALLNLYKSCSISDEVFNRDYPRPFSNAGKRAT
jgi:hypothetical protein